MREKSAKQLFDSGIQHQKQGRWNEALACYQRGLPLAPNSLPLLINAGFVSQLLNQYEIAAGFHERALKIDTNLVDERYNLGIAYKELMRLPEAEACYQRVLQNRPDDINAMHGLGIVKIMQGFATEADKCLRNALLLKPEDLSVRSCLLLSLNYCDNSPQQILQEHLEWNRHCHNKTSQHQPVLDKATRPLRIGYLSPDFCNHPVAYFIEPLLTQHDKTAFIIVCYSDTAHPDGITSYLREAVNGWRDVHRLSDDELARQIRQDKIDILVDLAGHTAQNRLAVFARKPAPVQVTYLGYPNTTGLTAIDYRLTDAWADPPGETEQLHSEALFRLPNGFLCYRPLEGTAVSSLPCEKTGYTTFGSFNNLAKLTPKVIALWARLLHTVPDARLLLKTKPLKDPATQEKIYQQFAGYGIDRKRVELVGWVNKMGDHLGLYNQVDIALDTFPYNGTTTTCEALWMGVPVITLAGQTHAGRVGVSLLSQTGLTEFIARDADHYIDLAAQLASNREQLAQLRSELRSRVAASPLCDASGFARQVEDAYRQMWSSNMPAKNTTG